MKRKMLEAAAHEIATDLFDVERHCDASIQAIARMALRVSAVREAAGLSVYHGQQSLDHLARTFAAITAARQQACDLHSAFDAENKRLGEPARNLGDGGKPTEAEVLPQMRRAA
jgi:hypothetical protein